MVTSFADGTKVSFEQAIVANATGMSVERRGMRGADHAGHVDELTGAYDVEELERQGGVVDYVVGAQARARRLRARHARRPEAASLPEPVQARRRSALQLLHALSPLPLRGAEHRRARGRCSATPPSSRSERRPWRSSTVAKTDLPAGTVLDGLGGYHTYGVAERADTTAVQELLPIGVAEGCRDAARHREGRGAHLRRRGAARGPPRRRSPPGAGGGAARRSPAGLTTPAGGILGTERCPARRGDPLARHRASSWARKSSAIDACSRRRSRRRCASERISSSSARFAASCGSAARASTTRRTAPISSSV